MYDEHMIFNEQHLINVYDYIYLSMEAYKW
jgi:hypothetical protein